MIPARAFSLACVLCCTWSARDGLAEDFTVGQNGLNSIQSAVNAALSNNQPDDRILIPPGTYLESVFISFASLTGTNVQERLALQRSGTGETVVQGSAGFPALHLQDVENVSLKKLTLNSGSMVDSVPALFIDGQSVNVECSGLNGIPGDDLGVVVAGSADLKAPTSMGVLFKQCDFSGMLRKGFWLNGIGHTLSKCVASGCGENGVVLDALSANCAIDALTASASLGQDVTYPGYVTVLGSGHSVSRVSVSGAGMHGFQLNGEGLHLEDCDATNNGDSCYFIADGSAVLKSCDASGNLFGLRAGALVPPVGESESTVDGLSVDGGKFNHNSSHGLLLSGDGAHIRSISASGNGGHGILVRPEAERVVVRGCAMKKNGGQAVQVEGELSWLEDNQAKQGDGFSDLGTNNGGRNNKVKAGATNDF